MVKISVKYASVLLLAVAVLLKAKPYLVFKVPYVGWLLASFIGYDNFPMFHLDAFSKCYKKENCPWLRSGDLVIDVCAKCGTNWMLTAVHELRTWDQPDLNEFRDILDISPWPEFVPYPAADRDHLYNQWQSLWNISEFKFRQFKSHLAPFRVEDGIRRVQIPIRERRDVKFLVMTRDPVDVLVSMYSFLPNLRPEWFKSWGDIPVPSTFADATEFIKIFEYMSPFTFFDRWMEFAGEENVLILHYANVLKDTKKYLKLIAKFLEIDDIPEEAFEELNERVSIEHMKKRGDHYTHLVGVNKSMPMLFPSTLLRKGGVGNSKGVVSQEEKSKVEESGKAKMKLENFKMMKNGFDAILNKKVQQP